MLDFEHHGAKVIDRLSHDLKTAFSDMTEFSPRNLKYMRIFVVAWPDRAIVQHTVAQLPWRSNLTLLDKLSDPETRLWYAQKAIELGMGKDMLVIQIETRMHERQGKAINNFPTAIATLLSDMDTELTALESKLTKAHHLKQDMMQQLHLGDSTGCNDNNNVEVALLSKRNRQV